FFLATANGGDDFVTPALDRLRVEAADVAQLVDAARAAARDGDERLVGDDRRRRLVLLLRDAFPPSSDGARDRTCVPAELVHPRQAAPDLLRVALVARLLERSALFAHPLQ